MARDVQDGDAHELPRFELHKLMRMCCQNKKMRGIHLMEVTVGCIQVTMTQFMRR
jgi:hypothetical protein